MLSFSPDDRYLVGISNFVLIVIDVVNASVREPLSRDIGAYQPNWSPRGDMIIYWRWPGFPGTPDDSAGLYFLDPWSGSQRIFLDENRQRLYGAYPLWSPDGKEIAFLKHGSSIDRICIVRADGTSLRVLATSPEHAPYQYLFWYTRPIFGIERLVFSQISGPGAGTYTVNRDGSGLTRSSVYLGLGYAPSPDGSEIVTGGLDPVDSLSVLFIRAVNDLTGATARQLTRYAPPPGAEAGRLLARGERRLAACRSEADTQEVSHAASR